MGLKSLSLQMLPWCFHMAGGGSGGDGVGVGGGGPTGQSGPKIRLIGSDGRVQVYHRPVSASELMKEFPRHLICNSDSFFIGQKVPPLSANEQLQLGHSYFLLPNQFFHSVLSFVTVATSLVMNTCNDDKKDKMKMKMKKKRMMTMRPFDIHKTDKGMLQIRISEELLMDMIQDDNDVEEEEEEEDRSSSSRVCSTKELEKEYRQLGKKREWKPKLETIGELYGYDSGMKKRRMIRFGVHLFFRRKNKTNIIVPGCVN